MADHLCGCPSDHQSSSRAVNVGDSERYASAVAGGFLLAVGLSGSSVWQRLGSLLIGGSLIHRGVSGHCMLYRLLSNPRKQEAERAEAQVDEAVEESFPASDPPAFNSASASRSRE